MKIRTIARAAMIRLAILAGILVVLTLFINLPWFDEELHEDLARLTQPQDIRMEGNAFPLVVGFLVAEDQDPREQGLLIIEAQREYFRTHGHTGTDWERRAELERDKLKVPAWNRLLKSSACNNRVELDCADRLIEEVAATQIDDPVTRLLLTRYERILDEPGYDENQEVAADTPVNHGFVATIAKIRLAEKFQDRDTARLLTAIGEDARFWKRMLSGEQILLAKMVALAGLRSDTMFMSTLLRTRELTPDQLREIRLVLAPLTESERNIEETFMAEIRFGWLSGGLDDLSSSTSLRGLISQKNATVNEYYRSAMLPLRLRASLSAGEFYRQRAHEPQRHSMRFMPPPLYNLGGKLALQEMLRVNNWQDYISRVHDLNGRIALVLLQAEIALHADREVEDVVKTSQYRNPYSGQPMDYDAAAGTIGFQCLAIGEDVCAVRIK